jgi:glycerol 3-phosphatase-2
VLGSSAEPLHQAYDAGLIDLDGVLYLGPDSVPHAGDSIAAARAVGMRIAFVTNNASRSTEAVAAHLTELGIPATAEDVVSSAQAVARWLTARLARGSTVLVLGTPDLRAVVEAAGFVTTREAPGAVAVAQGLDPKLSWEDLAEACLAINAGALWVAGNRDATYPSSRGPVPGNGAFVAALETATGRSPVVVGKPEPELHQVSVDRVAARRPLVVGDRLDTDVLGAVRAGSDSLLVLTGVTSREELLAAPEGMRPTYVASDLRGLGQSHEAPVVTAVSATCGSAKAWYDGDVLHQSDDSDDALRAACALRWSRER